MTIEEFSQLGYGMFVHFGVYSMIGRGEWVMNRERIAPEEMEKIARDFHPDEFDAGKLCDLAVSGGMRYIVFTTMHHDGFRMYDSALSPFCAGRYCKRDFVREVVDAARSRGLKIGLYHSLNNWHDAPDAAAALESRAAYEKFIGNTFERLRELVTRFAPIDIMWYDGWWPFDSDGWQAAKMNEMVRRISPGVIFNGRNALPGDFATPEQHLTAPKPYRPWEACVTLNDHWGFHPGDRRWKSATDVVDMLLACGGGGGNLLLNVGPDGRGVVPQKSAAVIRRVGRWLRSGGREAITGCDRLELHPQLPEPGERGDWVAHGRITASGNTLFYTVLCPVDRLSFCGMIGKVKHVSVHGLGELAFTQTADKVEVALPEPVVRRFCPVVRFECDRKPGIYRTGGMRVPKCRHPRYDPLPPDIRY